jgi:hypothetical protein
LTPSKFNKLTTLPKKGSVTTVDGVGVMVGVIDGVIDGVTVTDGVIVGVIMVRV